MLLSPNLKNSPTLFHPLLSCNTTQIHKPSMTNAILSVKTSVCMVSRPTPHQPSHQHALPPFSPLSSTTSKTGYADGSWKVGPPAEEVPPEIPEPVLGINFARDGMERKDWFALCAVHADAWLMSVLFFFAARYDDEGRAELFSLVNQHPTIYEVVTGRAAANKITKKKQVVYRNGNVAANNHSMHIAAGYAPPSLPQSALTAVAYNRRQDIAAVGATQQPPTATAAVPIAPLQFTGPIVSDSRNPTGRPVTADDVSRALIGRQAELFWPDDAKWYMTTIVDIDPDTYQAKVQYHTGEFEALDLEDVIQDGQLSLLPVAKSS